jgi:hypothetical protein
VVRKIESHILVIGALVIGTFEVVRLLHNRKNGKVLAFEAGQELACA